jgi:acyl-CoA synthetase (AMP-forming)/AMP-acid ligase II
MILVGASNVYPSEVESVLSEHPSVAGPCVIGLPDDDLGNAPDAIVAISSEVDADELAAQLRARLASDKPPRSLEREVGPPARRRRQGALPGIARRSPGQTHTLSRSRGSRLGSAARAGTASHSRSRRDSLDTKCPVL